MKINQLGKKFKIIENEKSIFIFLILIIFIGCKPSEYKKEVISRDLKKDSVYWVYEVTEITYKLDSMYYVNNDSIVYREFSRQITDTVCKNISYHPSNEEGSGGLGFHTGPRLTPDGFKVMPDYDWEF